MSEPGSLSPGWWIFSGAKHSAICGKKPPPPVLLLIAPAPSPLIQEPAEGGTFQEQTSV